MCVCTIILLRSPKVHFLYFNLCIMVSDSVIAVSKTCRFIALARLNCTVFYLLFSDNYTINLVGGVAFAWTLTVSIIFVHFSFFHWLFLVFSPPCTMLTGGLGELPVWRMKVSVLFPFFITPTGRIFGHIPTHNTSLYVVLGQGSDFWGLERWNLISDPLYPWKTLKFVL